MCQRKSHQDQSDEISDQRDIGVRQTLSDKRTCGILIQALGLRGSGLWRLFVQEYTGTNRMFRKECGGMSRFNGMRTWSRPGAGPWKSKQCGKFTFLAQHTVSSVTLHVGSRFPSNTGALRLFTVCRLQTLSSILSIQIRWKNRESRYLTFRNGVGSSTPFFRPTSSRACG